jgi:hypothetical protein
MNFHIDYLVIYSGFCTGFSNANPQILKTIPKKNKNPAISPNLPESGYSIKK